MTPEDSPGPASSGENSHNTSANASRPGSVVGGIRHTPRPRQNVKFSMAEDDDEYPAEAADPSALEAGLSRPIQVPEGDLGSGSLTPDWSSRTHAAAEGAHHKAARLASKLSSAPGSRRTSGVPSGATSPQQGKQHTPEVLSPVPEIPAQFRSNRSRISTFLHQKASSRSPKRRKRANVISSGYESPPLRPLRDVNLNDIPLSTLEKPRRPYDVEDTTDDDTDAEEEAKPLERNSANAQQNIQEAKRLIRSLTQGPRAVNQAVNEETRDGTETPAVDKYLHDLDYVPAPGQYKPGVLGALLSSKLSQVQKQGTERQNFYSDFGHPKPKAAQGHRKGASENWASPETQGSSGHSSGSVTPSGRKPKWYDKSPGNQSTSSMATLLASSSMQSAGVGAPSTTGAAPRPYLPRSRSSGMISSAVDIIKSGADHLRSKSDLAPEISDEMILEVADIIGRRKFLTKLCAALMMYGAPTHRLEEYMRTSARALQIEAEFLYMPGSMLCCFVDSAIYSTNVEMVRVPQAINLGRFKDTFHVYKCVIHGIYNADQGFDELNEIMSAKDQFTAWMRILAFGIAGVAVSPWAFSARPIDFAPIFILSALLGIMQLIVVPRSEQFSHVFEVFTAVITAFVARALGSIYLPNGTSLFCFSAMAQSSIALILPGYIVLNAALELQSRNMVSGSVRMVYAIIYTLFLGFGLLIGTTIFGLMYYHATSDVTCNIPDWWSTATDNYKLIYVKFIFVPIFTVCLAIINQAKWNQMPVMTLIAFCGYQANFWISTQIANNVQVANAIGAFVVGCMANLYSRFFHGLAAAAMLPAIFVQVPSGLAASGSLVAGITSANQITGNATGISVVNNGTQGFLNAQNNTNSGASDSVYGGTIFNVGYGMVQVAIGISVGLYLSALVVYPFGKRKSGLFSF